MRRELPDNPEIYDGVGLLKSENSGMKNHISTPEELNNLKSYIQQICALFNNKPVWYRINDASTSFVNKLNGDRVFSEPNPHFGLRGIRRALVCSETFSNEIKMIESLRDHFKNLNIIFPFVNDVKQYDEAVAIAKKLGYSGRMGSMIELPSALLNLNDFIDSGCDYFVFGMNDLTDCVEGCSRKNSETASLIYRDSSLKATRRLLGMVEWKDNVEYVLSGEITPPMLEILNKFKFSSVAIPYYMLVKDPRYIEMVRVKE